MPYSKFYSTNVESYDENTGITGDNTVYRIALEEIESGEGTFIAILDSFLADPKLPQVKGLTIGVWEYAFESDCEHVITHLVAHKDKLQHLEAIFVGDMDPEENEISWIYQPDLNPLFVHFPNLKCLKIRGGMDLRLGEINHANLETLIIETGGLHASVLGELANAKLPKLDYLELWMGTENYGFDGTVEDIAPLLKDGLFPSLTCLGLQNSEIADEIVELFLTHPLQSSIRALNLSMGVMSDKSVDILLQVPSIAKLDYLNVESNYLTKDGVGKLATSLSKIPIMELFKQKDPDEYGDDEYRYVDVSE